MFEITFPVRSRFIMILKEAPLDRSKINDFVKKEGYKMKKSINL